MEVTLKAGDSLQIPEGCKAVIKDNVVVKYATHKMAFL